ncbi:uncharacterized protein LOC112147627 isoform X2 [Oryzias melastigma]|uniref:uncharacterized protein LOC112147627 isoform X2 n=1 Tax=Oryzias melastigma TaxID=30732 RepID=UPI000CF81EFF|nr:uncharacterized protein LOC112147627 isoform X2 [Oryzias melastigma]
MLLHILFIVFLFLNSIKSQKNTTGIFQTTETVTTAKEIQPGVQLLASPDYPVSEGQRVQLQCKLLSGSTVSVDWTWQVLKGQTWKEVDSDGELILTKPEQSGVYRCLAGSNWSQNHTVSIVAIRASMGEVLGIAAFVLSLLVLITIIAGLLLVVWQRIGSPKTPSSPAVKEKDPGPKFEPKGDFPTEDGDGDYMNYTGKNSAYTDLDPSSLSADNEYSTV